MVAFGWDMTVCAHPIPYSTKRPMEKEIADKVPLLTEEGEYIPGMDHAIPANCSLTLFQEYAKHLRKYL
jgi:hypothetical protein